MLTSLKRIFRVGWLNFKRNSTLSVATILIMVLVVSLITSIFLFKGMADFLKESLQNKFDISVYFKEDALESEIAKTKEMLLELPEVKTVSYISKEEALVIFKERHKDNDTITQALDEIGINPFLASLNIQAGSIANYDAINNFLSDSHFQGLVDNIDYSQRKPMIESFYSLMNNIQKAGLVVAVILGLASLMMTFTTIRMAIYSSGDEIGIMRLVGASKWFIRGPFMVQGIICGLFASLAVFAVFGVASYFFSPKFLEMTGGFNLFRYFWSHLLAILGLQIVSGAGLGAVSSLAAVGKYLDK